jgi:AraC family transcriptional regulator
LGDFEKQIAEYRKQLQKGDVPAAYSGLMRYFDALRLHLKQRHPDYFISDVTYGCMDYTYLYYFPMLLKRRKLKIMLFFEHSTFEFHVWLAGYNKAAQATYLKKLKDAGWSKYTLAPTAETVDYIADYTVVKKPNFGDFDGLTRQIEDGLEKFIGDIEEAFFSK